MATLNARHFFGRMFHTRRIIIISERKTNHLSLSGAAQVSVMLAVIGCVSWASYSTGRYIAARSVLREQDETLRSVASSRIDTNFRYMVTPGNPDGIGPVSSAYAAPLTDPAYTLSAVNHDKLFARIALLETRVQQLQSTNAGIIQAVREKTRGKILSMEEIIRQAGLNPDALKEDALRQQRQTEPARKPAQGGPFIPITNGADPFPRELNANLDQLTLLHSIVETLPLGIPIADADPQSGFGRRADPFTGRLAFHAGVDLAAPSGAPVRASGDGKVVDAGWNGAYGNSVDIDHGLGLVTRYGHLSRIDVKAGDTVRRGQQVGVQGSTGRSTGPHLHYEVRYKNQPVDPVNFLNLRGVTHVSQNQ